MATQDPTRSGADDPASEDRRTERAVLALLLDEHPTRLTMAELVLVLHADPEHNDPGDAAQRAVRELIAAGLVHRDGAFLIPSRAALYFTRLEMD